MMIKINLMTYSEDTGEEFLESDFKINEDQIDIAKNEILELIEETKRICPESIPARDEDNN